jgi:hypothetical protein
MGIGRMASASRACEGWRRSGVFRTKEKSVVSVAGVARAVSVCKLEPCVVLRKGGGL